MTKDQAEIADTLGMSEKFNRAVEAAMEGGRTIDQAEAYVFAVGVLRDTVLQLTSIGIQPNECTDAVGYTLINLTSGQSTTVVSTP